MNNKDFMTFRIFDITAIVVKSGIYHDSIDVSNMPEGVYVIVLSDKMGQMSMHSKFVKIR
jgi:hypothetical protein